MTLKVWVLIDERIGNSNQAIALARLLGLSYETKYLKYNKLASLPFFFQSGFKLLAKDTVESLKNEAPDIIISSGRRAASVALAIKDKNNSCKIIQILRPQRNYRLFDLVILPTHDKKRLLTYPENVIFTPLALSFFSNEELEQESFVWRPTLLQYKQPYLAVLIGGDSKKCKFKESHIEELSNIITNVAKAHSGSLLISSSRRTPDKLVEKIKENLNQDEASYYFYEPNVGSQNPYKAFLNFASSIIVTGDSISMCSEACSLGKPVYIYLGKNMVSSKHKAFINHLYKTELATPLEQPLKSFKSIKNGINQQLITTIKQRLGL